MQSSLNSGVSVGTQHNGGCRSVDVAVQADARDIAIQTLSSYELEIDELNKSIDELQSARAVKSQCVSQGTQMSPMVNRRIDNEKSYKTKRSSPSDNNENYNLDRQTSLCNDKRYDKNLLHNDEDEKESLICNNDLNRIQIINCKK